jgi:hypothetical protein
LGDALLMVRSGEHCEPTALPISGIANYVELRVRYNAD